jgi:type IV pilus assembly protein PilQ
VNLSHRLFGVCIGMLTVTLGCGGCSVPKSAVPPLTAEHRDTPGRAAFPGLTTETLVDTSSPASRQTAVQASAATPWLASSPEQEPATMPGTVITGITFEAGADRSIVAVQTAGTAPQVQVKQQRDPARLALDIKPAYLSPTHQKAMTVHDPGGVVTRLEALPGTDGQADIVRVVIYLRTVAAFEVQQDNDIIRLAIAKSSTTTAAARPPGRASSPTALAPSFVPVPSRLGPPVTLPVAATAPRVVPQSTPSVRRGTTAEPSGAASATAARRAGPPLGAGLSEPPAFTGEKISLDFQDADINDILRLIAEVGGVNIIAGGDVQGKVTTRMVDVPWDQALDVILKINGLAQERSGNIIRVVPLTKLTQERLEQVRAQKAEVEAEQLVTRVVPVSFAAAKDLLNNLKTLLTPTRGKMFIDERTNTMILTDTQSTIDHMLALVEKLDRPTRQVMIEARIVESSRDFTRQLGIQLGLSFSQITDRVFPNRIDVRGGLTPPASAPGMLVPPAAPANYLLNLPAAVGLGSGGALGFSLASIGGAILDAQLSAMESSGRGKIISSPKIATLDNTEAVIQSGTTFYVPTVSSEGTRTQAVDAFITLKVTPHVTPTDFISMKITATKNDVDFGKQAANLPTVIKREATTDMLVKDGETVVIGGLYKRRIESSRAGVPGLSSLPVIGWLFRKEAENDSSEELLIFLTPRIIQQDDATGKRRAALSY